MTLPGDTKMWVATKWAGSGIVAYWAGLNAVTKTLVVLISADWVTGLIAAVIAGGWKSLSSEVGFVGLLKKVLILTLVWVAHYVSVPLDLGLDLGKAAAIGFSVNEFISIIENCQRAGVAIPQPIMDVLMRLRGKQQPPAPTA